MPWSKTAPSHTIGNVHELYQQLLSKKSYHHKKTRTYCNPGLVENHGKKFGASA